MVSKSEHRQEDWVSSRAEQMHLRWVLVRIQASRARVPPRPQPRVAGFDLVGNLRVKRVDFFVVLYDPGAVEKNSVQRALGTEDG